MSRISIVGSVLIAAVVLAAPARAEDVRAAIEAGNAKLIAAFAARDAAGVAMAYAEDAMMLPPDATRVVGHAAIEALWKSWIEAGLTDLTLEATNVDGDGGKAYEVGNFTMKAPVEGSEPVTATGTYLVVWERGADGVWRLLVDTWNDTPPPVEAQPGSKG